MNTELMFSSKSDMWSTPQDFFDALNAKYNFTIDVCATSENSKCGIYIDREMDSIKTDWMALAKESHVKPVFWMNPPYGNSEKVCKKNCNKKNL